LIKAGIPSFLRKLNPQPLGGFVRTPLKGVP
jgi:hypothetical protein